MVSVVVVLVGEAFWWAGVLGLVRGHGWVEEVWGGSRVLSMWVCVVSLCCF